MMRTNEVSNLADAFCSVALYLYGDSISVDGVSQLLGLQATASRIRGEKRVTSSGSEIVQKISFWEYRMQVASNQIAPSLVDMLGRIKCNKIVGMEGVEKAELDIFMPLDTESDNAGMSFDLPSDVVEKISRLGLDVIVTVR